jgi:hypothetical protein
VRTFLRQDKQVRNSDDYDDTHIAGPTLETDAENLEDDLNAIRSQIKRIIHGTNPGSWTDVGGTGTLSDLRWDIEPLGVIDGSNLVFTTPEKFIQSVPLTILVYRNGQRQMLGGDYTVSESGGFGTGYDTITFVADAKIKIGTVLRVDYVAA